VIATVYMIVYYNETPLNLSNKVLLILILYAIIYPLLIFPHMERRCHFGYFTIFLYLRYGGYNNPLYLQVVGRRRI